MNIQTQDYQADLVSITDLEVMCVDAGAPKAWLSDGWAAFRAMPIVSGLYGLLFALACLGTLALISAMPGFTAAFLTGLLLIGPLLAAGLYVAARQHGAGEPVSISRSLSLLWDRRTNLALFGVYLGLVMAAWVRLSALIFAVHASTFSPSTANYLIALTGGFDPLVTSFFVVIGAMLALTVFVTSAVAVPLIIDRDAGPIVGIQASWRAVMRNRKTMALWALIIVGLTLVGVMTAFVGMVVLFPLLGYATWSSYQALVH